MYYIQMLYTLGLFLSDQERKLSRLTCTPPPPAEGEEGRSPYNYEPNLYLQGFVVVSTAVYTVCIYIQGTVYVDCKWLIPIRRVLSPPAYHSQ